MAMWVSGIILATSLDQSFDMSHLLRHGVLEFTIIQPGGRIEEEIEVKDYKSARNAISSSRKSH